MIREDEIMETCKGENDKNSSIHQVLQHEIKLEKPEEILDHSKEILDHPEELLDHLQTNQISETEENREKICVVYNCDTRQGDGIQAYTFPPSKNISHPRNARKFLK